MSWGDPQFLLSTLQLSVMFMNHIMSKPRKSQPCTLNLSTVLEVTECEHIDMLRGHSVQLSTSLSEPLKQSTYHKHSRQQEGQQGCTGKELLGEGWGLARCWWAVCLQELTQCPEDSRGSMSIFSNDLNRAGYEKARFKQLCHRPGLGARQAWALPLGSH